MTTPKFPVAPGRVDDIGGLTAFMQLIDTHAHLTAEVYHGQLEAVLGRACRAGVGNWIAVGTDLGDSRAAVALSKEWEKMYCTVGVHPHEAADVEPDYIEQLRQLASHSTVCAIGEIGLDYHYEFSRRVMDECGPEDINAVFHCFSGNYKQARALLERGFFISFAGTITFHNAAELQKAAQYVPLKKVLLETDCPYLSPEPKRKLRPNEPAMLRYTAAKLAELRQVSLVEIAEAATRNSRSFFGL